MIPKDEPVTDILAGGFFLLTGLVFGAIALTYPIGELGNMGPGYFPLMVCAGLALVGVVLIGRSILHAWAARAATSLGGLFDWRSLFSVISAVAIFGLTINTFGLFIATAGMLLFLAISNRLARLWMYPLLYAVLVAFTIGVFVRLLSLPIPLGPS